MDISLKRLLGMADEGKRQYLIVAGEVTREEFEYCQLLDTLLFGDGGYVETLGPTWDMIHDPRFVKIEDAFIINRRAIFGGDAMVGKQYISSDGTFTSTIADLEQYAETLGEGRYFYTVLAHPDKTCPVRQWYLRIFPDMVKKEGFNVCSPGGDLVCGCTIREESGTVRHWQGEDPRSVKDWPDEKLWDLIKQECPNYFGKGGEPNGVAKRLFDLFRVDLLGLIADYAITPMSDVYIELDTGDVINQQAYEEQNGAAAQVFLEVDILEKALTQRAVLRATAAKILRQLEFQKTIKEELGDVRLTDYERDTLLRLVYNPPGLGGLKVNPGENWYGFLHMIKGQVLEFLKGIKDSGQGFKEREEEQLAHASQNAQNTFEALRGGELQVINQYTEPEVDVVLDAHAEIMQALLKNPYKQELFMVWVEAERRSGDTNKDDTDRLNMHRLYSMLTPIFTDADFVVDEAKFAEYMDETARLGFFSYQTEEVEEEFHGKTSEGA